jgi:hypothetical protein
MRRRRILRWAKWACTLAAVVAVGVAVLSTLCACRYIVVSKDGRSANTFLLCAGLIEIDHVNDWPSVSAWAAPGLLTSRPQSGHWFWGLSRESGLVGSQWGAGTLWSRDPSGSSVGVSLMYPFLLTVVPAALLWYANRSRIGPGICVRCGYDRRGLPAEAKCPECGTVPARG